MLYKKHKIKLNKLDLIRIKLGNEEDVCDLCCYGGKCTIISICAKMFTPPPDEPKNYDYICYIKEKQ